MKTILKFSNYCLIISIIGCCHFGLAFAQPHKPTDKGIKIRGSFWNEFREGKKPPTIKNAIKISNIQSIAPIKNVQYFDKTSQLQGIKCDYPMADDLLESCPSEADMRQIRSDFNITFDQALETNGVLGPWTCTNGGNESSLMLSVYNAFRLMKCIPFNNGMPMGSPEYGSVTFPWAPSYNNLYDWLKSTQLSQINFIWSGVDCCSFGGNKQIWLIGDHLGGSIYRQVVDDSSGAGLIDLVILIAHEARHADTGISHNCQGGKDTDLFYGGAWAVQYLLENMLGENTDYFSEYEMDSLRSYAGSVYGERFCDYQHF